MIKIWNGFQIIIGNAKTTVEYGDFEFKHNISMLGKKGKLYRLILRHTAHATWEPCGLTYIKEIATASSYLQ